jgi:hypothetical protein
MRDTMPTIPEDLTEYARIHTGPGSWSAGTDFHNVRDADFTTPRAPFVRLLELAAERGPKTPR